MVTRQNTALRWLVEDVCGRAFFVGLDSSARRRPRLTLHQVRDRETAPQASELRRALRDHEMNVSVRQRRHSWRGIERASSLEQLLKRFSHETVICDPTRLHARMTALTAFAETLRTQMEERIFGVYWNSDWRTLYVVFRYAEYVRDGHVKRADIAASEDSVSAILQETCSHLAPEFVPVVRLGFELPEVPVTPVDAASVITAGGAMGMLRRFAPVPALGAIFGFGLAGAAAADGHVSGAPAVSGANGKIGIAGGLEDQDNVSDAGTGRLIGSYTMPLGMRYGVQIDGMLGVNDDDSTGGVGGHLFWRDPSRALLGLTIGYAEVNRSSSNGYDKNITQLGAEGELYLGNLTLSGGGGGQWGNRVDDGVYGRADIHWYVSDNLMLSAGAQYDAEREGLARFGLEYQPPSLSMRGMSVFADARFGDEDYTHIRGGLRFYFGKSNSLKHRHRYDDPVTNTADYAADSLTGDPEIIILPPAPAPAPVPL